jgi:hypothetical protein
MGRSEHRLSVRDRIGILNIKDVDVGGRKSVRGWFICAFRIALGKFEYSWNRSVGAKADHVRFVLNGPRAIKYIIILEIAASLPCSVNEVTY